MPIARLLTVKDVMEMLQLSRAKIYTLISDKKINPIKIDGSTRFTEEELNKYLGKVSRDAREL